MKFTMQRDRTIATKFGHVIEFKKGVPTYVPPNCYDEVQMLGAIPEEPLPEPEPRGDAEPSDPSERAMLIEVAIEDIVKAGVRETFSAGGAPHTRALTKKLGWQVSTRERDIVWNKMLRAQEVRVD